MTSARRVRQFIFAEGLKDENEEEQEQEELPRKTSWQDQRCPLQKWITRLGGVIKTWSEVLASVMKEMSMQPSSNDATLEYAQR